MFGQVPPTNYDLRFRAFGIPVRVHPVFWLTSALLAWGSANDNTALLFVNILCIFVSILVHELGHALANKAFGFHSEIVLYFFGGYATSTRHSTWKDIAVSAAGPAAGFLLYAAIALPLRFSPWALRFVLSGGDLLVGAIGFSLFINLVWNTLNLIPVTPLDGGQICREFCMWLNPRKGLEISLIISTLAAGGMAAWSIMAYVNKTGVFGLDPQFLVLMFGYLAFKSYQAYEQARRGFW